MRVQKHRPEAAKVAVKHCISRGLTSATCRRHVHTRRLCDCHGCERLCVGHASGDGVNLEAPSKIKCQKQTNLGTGRVDADEAIEIGLGSVKLERNRKALHHFASVRAQKV